MDVLQASEDLVEEVAHMVIAQVLCLEQLVQVCLHQSLDDVPGEAKDSNLHCTGRAWTDACKSWRGPQRDGLIE